MFFLNTRLQQIEAEFYKYVRLKDVSQNLAVDMDIVLLIFNYWKLKRKVYLLLNPAFIL
jgi:hypothetical protein